MPSTANWGAKPSRKPPAQQPDAAAALESFVNSGKGQNPTKRLNLNIPASLHARIKAQCALEGRDMTDILIEVLESRFP